MENLLISIPKPCHEDWGKMTPEEKGRFCGKCSKTVLDFSDKTSSEILQYVTAHPDKKLCGRFRNEQLNQPVTVQLPALMPYRMLSPLQLFAMAVLLAFGTSLFSCTTPQGQTVGEISIIETSVPPEQTYIVPDPPERVTLGGVAFCKPPEPREVHIKGDTIFNTVVNSEPVINVEPDTIFKTLPAVEIESPAASMVECFTTGLIIQTVTVSEPVCTGPDSDITADNRKIDTPVTHDDFNSKMFPNPTGGLLNIDINLLKTDFVTADLYDVSGKHLSNLFARKPVEPGMNSLQVNISGHPTGVYLVKVASTTKTITEKVVLENK